MSQVWDLDLPPNEKLVLLAYADCANDKGVAWPSKAEISRKCRLHPDTVKRTGRSLREKGFMEVLQSGRGSGKGTGTAPIICVRVEGQIVPPQEFAVRGDALPLEGGRPAALRGVRLPPPSIREPSNRNISSASPSENPAEPMAGPPTNGKPPTPDLSEMTRTELISAGRGAIGARFMADVRKLRLTGNGSGSSGPKGFTESREVVLLEQMLKKHHDPIDIVRAIRGLCLLRDHGAVDWLAKGVPGTMRCLFHTKRGTRQMFQLAGDYYLKLEELKNGKSRRDASRSRSARPVPVEIKISLGGGEGHLGCSGP